MAPRKALANISFTVDSASEDDMTQDELNALPTPESNAENKAPAKKARGKAAPSTAAAKGRPATRRVSGSSVLGAKKTNAAVAKKAPAKAGRRALVERKAVNGSDTEDVDGFGEDEATAPVPAPATKRGRPARAQKAQDE
ncbi:hypothetical protein BDU57DRAFT_431190, partial [Ampelomyces quisqualis]